MAVGPASIVSIIIALGMMAGTAKLWNQYPDASLSRVPLLATAVTGVIGIIYHSSLYLYIPSAGLTDLVISLSGALVGIIAVIALIAQIVEVEPKALRDKIALLTLGTVVLMAMTVLSSWTISLPNNTTVEPATLQEELTLIDTECTVDDQTELLFYLENTGEGFVDLKETDVRIYNMDQNRSMTTQVTQVGLDQQTRQNDSRVSSDNTMEGLDADASDTGNLAGYRLAVATRLQEDTDYLVQIETQSNLTVESSRFSCKAN